ncbi:MAG: Glu/Leu/Phe/Val family dehydrogenase [Thiobacillaceae bacterium]
MEEGFRYADELGPSRIVHVYEPSVGLKGILVIDNVAAGPAIGGLRMAPDVSTEECVRLARAMTLKNAAAGLPHGGGKSVIFGDPHMPVADKARLIRAFARALGDVSDYIFGPDMGTDEVCMAWVRDEIGRAVGLPRELGGIPLDEIGATGFGLAHVVDVAAPYAGLTLQGARVAIQGFGAVGKHAACFLAKRGAVLVAASDSHGTVYDPQGLDLGTLIPLKQAGRSVIDNPAGQKLDREAILDVECDIWIPAARPDVVREDNAHRLRTRLVVEGANIPCTPGAEQMLHARGVLCVPDFIANAGGVICAAMEYHGAGEQAALQAVEHKIRENTREVLRRAQAEGILPRQAALDLAIERVKRAMRYRRHSLTSGAPGHL